MMNKSDGFVCNILDVHMKKIVLRNLVFSLFFIPCVLKAQNYPDQFYVMSGDSLAAHIETTSGVRFDQEQKSFVLEDTLTSGYVILEPAFSDLPFNLGLPSWNGSASGERCSFKIQMRFPYGNDWSPWLTVGFWKVHLGASYGTTSFSEGYVDIDNVKLSVYKSSWQFRILMSRLTITDPSPTLHKLSFFVSDSRTTENYDLLSILNDNPDEIFVDTEFFYQYAIDDEIGGRICSPTSVSMVLRSYGIDVNPYQFALDTYDPVWDIFGVWPRVVQNASEYGLNGAVTRYRTWSETREVLAKNGRVVMSVGSPLYPSGHLIMLAGFNEYGSPIVHDPAKSSGYCYLHNKSQLSQSWFNKGGIAYTFYPGDSIAVSVAENHEQSQQPANFVLYQNYPNPFNPATYITFTNVKSEQFELSVYDISGRFVTSLFDGKLSPGKHSIRWDASSFPSGTYLIRLRSNTYQEVIKSVLIK
jgi:hypothetical protein